MGGVRKQGYAEKHKDVKYQGGFFGMALLNHGYFNIGDLGKRYG